MWFSFLVMGCFLAFTKASSRVTPLFRGGIAVAQLLRILQKM